MGQSHNKFSFLPESHTDFAFCVLGEEWGLFGTLLVISMVVLYRLARLRHRRPGAPTPSAGWSPPA